MEDGALNEIRSGGCLCGAVKFTTNGPLRGIIYCHCTQCRKQSGHFYAATSVARANITISGEDSITWHRASREARRGFCSTCGSALFWQRDGADKVSVLAGAFDSPTGLVGERHIFVADKGDYYEIEDGLPREA
jgi:hypothetical protein